MASTARSRSIATMILGPALGAVLFAASGCGENPSRLAGTIELPEKKSGPPPDTKTFEKDRAKPKNPTP